MLSRGTLLSNTQGYFGSWCDAGQRSLAHSFVLHVNVDTKTHGTAALPASMEQEIALTLLQGLKDSGIAAVTLVLQRADAGVHATVLDTDIELLLGASHSSALFEAVKSICVRVQEHAGFPLQLGEVKVLCVGHKDEQLAFCRSLCLRLMDGTDTQLILVKEDANGNKSESEKTAYMGHIHFMELGGKRLLLVSKKLV